MKWIISWKWILIRGSVKTFSNFDLLQFVIKRKVEKENCTTLLKWTHRLLINMKSQFSVMHKFFSKLSESVSLIKWLFVYLKKIHRKQVCTTGRNNSWGVLRIVAWLDVRTYCYCAPLKRTRVTSQRDVRLRIARALRKKVSLELETRYANFGSKLFP